MAEICLIHLVRAANGLKPFREFLTAYAAAPGGAPHRLVFLYKGFSANEPPAEFQKLASEFEHERLLTHDRGLDIRAYGLAARSFDQPYFCFLNSFSKPLDSDWLTRLEAVMRQPGVGLAGATGSWESMYSNLFVPDPAGQRPSLVQRFWRPIRVLACKRCFEPFPNWHLRTNAFVVSRENVLRFWPRSVWTKRNAYLFESGKDNLSRQMFAAGLDVRVVGRDGRSYPKEQWAESMTYRSGNQENLLVSDSQTQRYEQADPTLRRHLRRLAWGDKAV